MWLPENYDLLISRALRPVCFSSDVKFDRRFAVSIIFRNTDRVASYIGEAQRSLFVEMAVEELDFSRFSLALLVAREFLSISRVIL